MAESLKECLARAAACRAAAASEALENVRQVHLEAAASWEMLAGRAQWVNSPNEPSSYHGLAVVDGTVDSPCTSNRPVNYSPFRAEPLGTVVPAEIDTPTAESAELDMIAFDVGEEAASPDAEIEAQLQQIACKVMLYTIDGHMRTLREIEADVISLAIEIYQGRMAEVARRLGIGRSTLYRKLNELGLDVTA